MNTIELLIEPENEISQLALLNLWLEWLKPELEARGKIVRSKNNHVQINFASREEKQINEEFKEQFEAELAKRLQELKQKILLTSLDESITQICSQFNIFEIESELPFVQTLIDKSGELKTTLSNDLSNLLFWWNEKGYRTSVNVNEEVDSIRLLTVHKSKGLEYKAVLIPYLDWTSTWSGHNTPLLWCKPENAPFNQFPLLPIKAGTDMDKSYFQNIYREEKVNYIVDSFNLAYVAFTRAKSVLIINCPAPNLNSKSPGKSMHHLLFKSLGFLGGNAEFTNSWNSENDIFSFGTIPQFSREKKDSNAVVVTKYQFNDFSEKIKLRISGDDFLISGEKNTSIRNKGKIIHDILSEIETLNDIKKASLNAFNNGLINETELGDIQTNLTNSIDELGITNWFNGSYKILNERSLLSKEQILRPDRIMVSGNETKVVDYKTGEKKSDSYNTQVRKYAKTIKETGAKKVIGFLWYINQNELEKVCEF